MAKGKRKLYAYRPGKQHDSVKGYVERYLPSIDTYLNDNAEKILAEKKAAKAAGKYFGHDMGYAGGILKKEFKSSLNKALKKAHSGSKKAMAAAKKRGKPTSVGKIVKHAKNQHVVKFGVDPFHS